MNRYVSAELTHFVGRGKAPEEQYKLLLGILRDGRLIHPPHHPGNMSIRKGAKISSNNVYRTATVCFCDIPEEMFRIHMKKYGEFGISFSKNFLVSQGASPVFYVSSRSTVHDGLGSRVTLADHFDQRTSIYQQLADKAVRRDWPDLTLQDGASLRNSALLLQEFIDYHFLSFVKFFDPSRLDDDQENYYMEREWRVLGEIQFELNDVVRITVPQAYEESLRKDLPAYMRAVYRAEDAK